MKLLNKAQTRRRGAALVEYGLIIAGVALVSAAGISIFGKKTSDMIGSAAAVLPGANPNDNGKIQTGRLIETQNVGGVVGLNTTAIGAGGNRLENNLGLDPAQLIVDNSTSGSGGSGGSGGN